MHATLAIAAFLTRDHLIIAAAVIVLGLSKTGFGGGGIGILSVPLMTMAMPPAKMIGVLGILLVAVDLISNLHYLGDYDWPVLKWLIPGAILGVLIGAAALVFMRDQSHGDFNRNLSLIIGVVCLIFVAAQCFRVWGGNIPTLRASPGHSLVIGGIAGGVSTVSHSAGPIVTLYMLQERVSKRQLIGTMLIYTLLINTVKLVVYAAIGLVTFATLKDSLWMLPILPIGTLAGVWMNKRLPEKPFMIIMYIAAAVTAGQMIYRALA